jgi:hypothetical protein
VRISFCEHSPPAVSLVRLGAFSSTPIRPPAWAFDIVLLEYMSKQFAYGTPDVTAWCNATCSFLSSQGVEKVPTPVRLLTVCSLVRPPYLYFIPECASPPSSVRSIALSAYPRQNQQSSDQCNRFCLSPIQSTEPKSQCRGQYCQQ